MPSKAIIFPGRMRVPESVFDLAGFLRWAHSPRFPRHGKASYISGEVYLEMSPEEIRSHNSAKRDVTNLLCHFAFREDVGEVFADRTMLIEKSVNLATEPDVMFCRWETLESGRVTLAERIPGSGRQVEVHGTPDLVVEIVSNSSVKKDTEMLRETYYQAGIPEYWLIDARGEQIHFLLLIPGEAGYQETIADEQGFLRSNVLDRRVKLTRELNRIGGWRYTLEIL